MFGLAFWFGAREIATWLAETLGLRPFSLPDENRAAYHAGADVPGFVKTITTAAPLTGNPSRRILLFVTAGVQ